MKYSVEYWHQRFLHQAIWTDHIRRHFFNQVLQPSNQVILEVGCGTGAILKKLPQSMLAFGLDINLEYLQHAFIEDNYRLLCGDAHSLPIMSSHFDLVYCHYLLLWVDIPPVAIKEMVRVIKPGGYIFVMAEPDYSARIDFPDIFKPLGDAQTQSLISQGANPYIGKTIPDLLYKEGVSQIEFGIFGNHTIGHNEDSWHSEWQMYRHDLTNNMSPEKMEELEALDKKTSQEGRRIQFVPTFYAYGRKA